MTLAGVIVLTVGAGAVAYLSGYLMGLMHGVDAERDRQRFAEQERFYRSAQRIGRTILNQTSRSIAQEGYARPMTFAEVLGPSTVSDS